MASFLRGSSLFRPRMALFATLLQAPVDEIRECAPLLADWRRRASRRPRSACDTYWKPPSPDSGRISPREGELGVSGLEKEPWLGSGLLGSKQCFLRVHADFDKTGKAVGSTGKGVGDLGYFYGLRPLLPWLIPSACDDFSLPWRASGMLACVMFRSWARCSGSRSSTVEDALVSFARKLKPSRFRCMCESP